MRTLIACLVAALAFTGCSSGGNDAFCTAAKTFSEFDPQGGDSLDDATEAFEDLADTAPDEIADDARMVADAFAAAATGDVSQINQESVTAAAQNVQEYAEANCDGIES